MAKKRSDDPRIDGRRNLSVAEALFDATVRHSFYVERLKGGEAGRVVNFFEREVFEAVSKKLNRLQRLGKSETVRARQLKRLQIVLGDAISKKVRKIRNETMVRIEELALDEVEWVRQSLINHYPIVVDFVSPPVSLTAKALRVQGPKANILGRSWNEWWDGLARNVRDGTMREVRIGIAQGESVREMFRRVERTVFKGNARAAESVVRTSITKIHNLAREATFEANRSIVKKIRWVSTLDAKTSQICISLDTQEFDPGKGPRPPAHVRCRSTTVMIPKSLREQGIDLDDLPFDKVGRAAKKYPQGIKKALRDRVTAKTSYSDWLKRQPKAVQNHVLGPGKADLFRRGKVPIERWVDSGYKPLSLRELRKIEERIGDRS